MAIRLKAIASRLEAIVSRLEAMAIRLKAIASRLKAIAIRLKAIASRLEAIASRLKTIAIRLSLLLSFLYLRLFMSPPGRLVFFVNVASHTTHCRCIAHLVAQLAHGFYHLPCVDLVPKHIVPGRSSKTRTVA